MRTSKLSALFTLLLVWAVGGQSLVGQNLRSDQSLFLKGRVGLAYYIGDNEKNPFSSDVSALEAGFPYDVGLEFGYQYTQAFSISLGYEIGNYLEVTEFGPNFSRVPLANPNSPYDNAEEYFSGHSTTRQSFQLMARYMFGADSNKLAPYVIGGLGVTIGDVTQLDGSESSETTFGPVLGAGVDYTLNGRTSLFLELLSTVSTDDTAHDLRDDNGATGFDFFNGLGVGVKFNFKKPFVPVQYTLFDGPTMLETNQEGVFETAINAGEATKPVTYEWDFGDGTTAGGMGEQYLTATHTYSQPGTYTVTVTASNKRSSDTRQMTVTVAPPPVPPSIVSLSSSPSDPDTNSNIRFTSNVQGDTPMTYAWDFGDGTTGEGANPTHTYAQPGTYTVTLRATNEAGTDTRTTTVTVRQGDAAICSTIVDLNSAFFGRNDSQLSAEAREALTENADIITQCPSMTVTINGFAALGERNPDDLSAARANAVAQFYRDLGIDDSQLVIRPMGVAEGTTKKDAAAQYRRVDSMPSMP